MKVFFSSVRSFIKKTVLLLAVHFLLYGYASNSFAGYREDRLVVWINLEEASDHLKVNKVIENFIISRRVDKECGVRWRDGGSILYMKKRPHQITNKLIREVFIQKKKAALQRLNYLLKSFRSPEDEVQDGLDGVMVYSNNNGPHMMNFVANRKTIKTYPLALKGSIPTAQDIEDAFCILLPSITRAP
ncbi:hypothetical protein [Variovorax sp. IB41]|uniref:hypothetical protein n=1 Tax=Variovorax sp. IB41 TaxID=2779370 RepID=UPI0018E82FF6|nr:hypothetical protein [Variovorax sp. IB41]MBJ2158385.1 hypothetical protein [Variovorax sp. IB41]